MFRLYSFLQYKNDEFCKLFVTFQHVELKNGTSSGIIILSLF